jgi:hypothetical protein
VHATLLKHKDEVEKEELRVELALAETHKQKRLEELHHAALDVTHGIDTFEINMKRLLKGRESCGQCTLAFERALTIDWCSFQITYAEVHVCLAWSVLFKAGCFPCK